MGCHVGNTFAGTLCYADDIILLAPTKLAMKHLLSVCEDFSHDYELMFNSIKSKTVVFSSKQNHNMFVLNGKDIEIVQKELHLGNYFGANSFQLQVAKNVKDLYVKFNLLLAQFSNSNVDTKYKLFKSFCMSVYGSQLWNFESNVCNSFYTAWRKCVKRLFRLPQRTHSCLLNFVCEDLPIDTQLHCRFGRFLNSCLESKSDLIRIVCKTALVNPLSNMSMSTNFICHKYKISKQCKDFYGSILKSYNVGVNEDYLKQGTCIKDFLLLHDDHPDNDIFDILEYLCCK